MRGKSLVVYLPDLAGGGVERIHINLAPHFLAAGLKLTFLLDRRAGSLVDKIPPGVDVHVLNASRQIAAIPRLVRYLQSHRVDCLLSNMEHANVICVWARRLAGARTKIIATQHNSFSDQVRRRSWKFKILPQLYHWTLPSADSIVCVSDGVARDLAKMCGLDRGRMRVIYNGVVTGDMKRLADEPVDHPWFTSGEPVLVAAGRLVKQKDYPTLLKAFAKLTKQKPSRLLILGEGPLRGELRALAKRLAIVDRVDMPGFVENPLRYMRRAAAFVLASRFEGFGNVLAEAMACGTPVVSTDCPHGPSEILDFGRYGRLAPPGQPDALAAAILATLNSPLRAEDLKSRAESFSATQCALSYLSLFSDLIGHDAGGYAHGHG